MGAPFVVLGSRFGHARRWWGVHVSFHLFVFRVALFGVLIIPSLNCVTGDQEPEACGCMGCGDPGVVDPPVPPEDPQDDDDDDDDSADDDDATPEVGLTGLLNVCRGGVLASLTAAALEPPQAGSGDYTPESVDLLATVRSSFSDLLDGYPAAAVTNAALVDYELCRGEDDERGFALWRPVDRSSGAARVVFRSLSASALVLGVPHGVSGPASLEAAVAVFEASRARVLIVGATHRCASELASPCGGTSSACGDGSDSAASISDMAAWGGTIFHVAHGFWGGEYPDDWVVTLEVLDDDGIALSDGTSAPLPTVPDGDGSEAVRLFADSLAALDEDVTACNAGLVLPHEERACGEDDQQGRALNSPGVDIACIDAPEGGSGRYVHIAASSELLGPDTVLLGVFAAIR